MSQRFKLLFLASSFFISLTRLTVGMDGEGEFSRNNPSPLPNKFALDIEAIHSVVPSPEASPFSQGDHPGPAIPWPNSQSFPSSQGFSSQEALGSPLSRQVSHYEGGDDLEGAIDPEEGSLNQLGGELPEHQLFGMQGHSNRNRPSPLTPQVTAITEHNIPRTE